MHIFVCTIVMFSLTLTLHVSVDHRSCTQEFDALSIDTSSPVARFCEKKCREVIFQGFGEF